MPCADDRAVPAALGFRMPAEWEPHAATWLAWPHKEESWPGNFVPIPGVWVEMVRALAPHEHVNILVDDDAAAATARRLLHAAQVSADAVTLHVNGQDVRFVNTHTEIQAFRDVQEQQAGELAAMLADEPLPIVLVGDFNSAANPSAPAGSKTGTYHILRNAGFADLELRDGHSNDIVTCCHLADLSDVVPTFDQRLDLVFARWGKAGFGGQSDIEIVTGQRFPDHDYFLWPSDHAAVFGKIWPAPGLASK